MRKITNFKYGEEVNPIVEAIADELDEKYGVNWSQFLFPSIIRGEKAPLLSGRCRQWSITLFEHKISISDYDTVWDVAMPRRYDSEYGNPKLFDEINEMLST